MTVIFWISAWIMCWSSTGRISKCTKETSLSGGREKQRKDAWEQAENERLKQDIRRLESSARVKEQWADDLEARKLGKKAAAEAQKKRKHHKRKTAADRRKVKKNAAAEKESGAPAGAGHRGEGRPFEKSGDHRGFETVSAPPSQRDIW